MDNLNRKPSQYVELICAATGERFLKYKGEYNRQVKKGVTRFFKDQKTATEFIRQEIIQKALVVKECRYCGKPFNSTAAKKARVCCSQECAHACTHQTINENPEAKAQMRQRKSEAMKRLYSSVAKKERPHPLNKRGLVYVPPTQEELTRICIICDKPFLVPLRCCKPKTCSKVCRNILSSRQSSANPNCGGETNYRRYRYKGILMDSQWEVDIATWLDERQIEWQRDRKMTFRWIDETGKSRRYHPDFYLPAFDIYLDPKNKYLIEKDRFKIESVMKTHGIKIIWGLRDDVINHLQTLSGS